MAKNYIYGCRLVGPSIGATVYCKCCRPTFLCGHFGILVYFSCSCLQITIWRWNKCICFGNLRQTGIVPNYCNRFLISQRSILLHFSSREKYVTSSTKLKRDQKFSETSTESKPSRSALLALHLTMNNGMGFPVYQIRCERQSALYALFTTPHPPPLYLQYAIQYRMGEVHGKEWNKCCCHLLKLDAGNISGKDWREKTERCTVASWGSW